MSRHFIPLPELAATVDGCAALRLNVLHLHLSDDQGWRLESAAFPGLHTKAAGQPGPAEYLTAADVRWLVDYAALRGGRVVPEVDLPGHATAL
eukprot:SAG22_NODE_19011_length_279_cov_0.572222_1_plen_92_part_11